MKFLSVGAIATIIQYLIFIALVELGNVEAVTASALGYGLSSIFNYLLIVVRYHMQDVKCHIVDVRCQMLEVGCQMTQV